MEGKILSNQKRIAGKRKCKGKWKVQSEKWCKRTINQIGKRADRKKRECAVVFGVERCGQWF